MIYKYILSAYLSINATMFQDEGSFGWTGDEYNELIIT